VSGVLGILLVLTAPLLRFLRPRHTVHPEHKKAHYKSGLFLNYAVDRLLDLGFLVHHVFTDNGIILLHLHFSGRVLFVFIRGVKVTGLGG
jgi:hypothetical protein